MPKPGTSSNAAPCKTINSIIFIEKKKTIDDHSYLAMARTIQAKKRRTKNAGKPRPPRDLLQKKT